jgi:hypothetical protein
LPKLIVSLLIHKDKKPIQQLGFQPETVKITSTFSNMKSTRSFFKVIDLAGGIFSIKTVFSKKEVFRKKRYFSFTLRFHAKMLFFLSFIKVE